MEVACACDEGFGLPHSHVYAQRVEVVEGRSWLRSVDTGEVRMWVPWYDVARAILPSGAPHPVTGAMSRVAVRQGGWP